MQQEVQVTFHNIEHSDAIESDIRNRVEKLSALYNRMIGCRVVVDSPHRNHAKGKTYSIKIEMALPGQELVVNREPVGDFQHAVSEAFDVAKRRLKDFADKQRNGH